jgi:hypothetical protein
MKHMFDATVATDCREGSPVPHVGRCGRRTEGVRAAAVAVHFTQEPTEAGGVAMATFADTRGNLIRSCRRRNAAGAERDRLPVAEPLLPRY